MEPKDDLPTSLAHLALIGVAGAGLSKMNDRFMTYPGMHTNFLVHGVLGIFHYQSSILNNNFGPAYKISFCATKYLALPCLMADLYQANNKELSGLHLISGLIPFGLSLIGEDNIVFGNIMIAINIISLIHYSARNENNWGWGTAAAAAVTYFGCPALNNKIFYPLGLAVTEYCAYRLFHVTFDAPPPRR